MARRCWTPIILTPSILEARRTLSSHPTRPEPNHEIHTNAIITSSSRTSLHNVLHLPNIIHCIYFVYFYHISHKFAVIPSSYIIIIEERGRAALLGDRPHISISSEDSEFIPPGGACPFASIILFCLLMPCVSIHFVSFFSSKSEILLCLLLRLSTEFAPRRLQGMEAEVVFFWGLWHWLGRGVLGLAFVLLRWE